MTKARIDLGKRGEELAVQLLEDDGWTIIDRNFRVRSGEIDLVAQRWEEHLRGMRRCLAFVEVKTRRLRKGTRPEHQITWSKRRRLTRLARIYLKIKGFERTRARFDVVAIDWLGEDRFRIRHHKSAFDASGCII